MGNCCAAAPEVCNEVKMGDQANIERKQPAVDVEAETMRTSVMSETPLTSKSAAVPEEVPFTKEDDPKVDDLMGEEEAPELYEELPQAKQEEPQAAVEVQNPPVQSPQKPVDEVQERPAEISGAKSGWFVPKSASDRSDPSQLAISTQESTS